TERRLGAFTEPFPDLGVPVFPGLPFGAAGGRDAVGYGVRGGLGPGVERLPHAVPGREGLEELPHGLAVIGGGHGRLPTPTCALWPRSRHLRPALQAGQPNTPTASPGCSGHGSPTGCTWTGSCRCGGCHRWVGSAWGAGMGGAGFLGAVAGCGGRGALTGAALAGFLFAGAFALAFCARRSAAWRCMARVALRTLARRTSRVHAGEHVRRARKLVVDSPSRRRKMDPHTRHFFGPRSRRRRPVAFTGRAR